MKKPWMWILGLLPAISACTSFSESDVIKEETSENQQESVSLDEDMEEQEENEVQNALENETPQTYSYEIREILSENQGESIYGVLYVPEKEGALDLVIASHGLGGDYLSLQRYASDLARKGVAVYCLEFRGGGGQLSQGDPLQMSIMSEVSDLNAVLEQSKTWGIEISRTFLMGQSQGGIVSAIEAARNPEQISGLILLYPAFNIPFLVRDLFSSLDEVPESFRFTWFTAGYSYVADVFEYDPYSEIAAYTGPVLIIHGDEDPLVELDYSIRADAIYPDSELIILPGGGHGFNGALYTESFDAILSFLKQNSD